MADLFPERLEPATGVTALERRQAQRDPGQSPRRRQPPPPVRAHEPELEASEPNGEPPHQLDRMA